MIGRWNRPTNFDPLIGDLLDMSTPGQSTRGHLDDGPCALGRLMAVPQQRLEPAEVVRKSFGRRFGPTRVVLESFLSATRCSEFERDSRRPPEPMSEAALEWSWSRFGVALHVQKADGRRPPATLERISQRGSGMNRFDRLLRNLMATLSLAAVPRFAASSPSPEPGEQQAEQLQRIVDAINAGLQGLVFVLGHAVVVATHVVVVAAAPVALLWLGIKVGGPRFHQARHQTRLTSLQIVPPVESIYEPKRWVAVFKMLYAIARPWWKRAIMGQPWLIFELEACDGQLTARCTCLKDLERLVTGTLRRALPDADILPAEVTARIPGRQAARARLRLWREDIYPLGGSETDPFASAAQALAEAGDGMIQIAIAPDTGWEKRAAKRLDQLSGIDRHESLVSKLIRLPMDLLYEFCFSYPKSTSAAIPELRRDQPLPGGNKARKACWRAEVRLRCWAPTAKAAVAGLHAIVAAFYAEEGENSLRPKKVWWSPAFDNALEKRLGPGPSSMVLSPEELPLLFHLPLPDVPMDSARIRVVPRQRQGMATGTLLSHLDGVVKVPARISQEDRRQHVHILGPTGVGKSTLLLNLALQDIDRGGIGVGVIDPKGDLIRDLLERIPPQHADRIVLIDPSIRERPIGLNVLECDDPAQRELVTDGVVTIFRKSFERFWGPRTDDVLRAALLTLLRHPETTITEVPSLLLDRRVRSRLTKNLGDPVGLKPFWHEYDAQSDGQRLQMVGPVLNKLRTFLLRPTVRNVLGQSRSTIDLKEVIDRQRFLLINLAKGELGDETSRLLGAFIVSRIWQAATARSSRPERWRPDFNLYLDEFHDYLYLPQSIDEILAQARGYRLCLTLANQHYAQLHESTRQGLTANARTRVVFQLGPDDARIAARDFEPMTAHQLQSLDRFQMAVRLNIDGHTSPAFTGLALPMPPGLGAGHAAELRFKSAQRYGRPVADVEAEIVERLSRFGGGGPFKEIA